MSFPVVYDQATRATGGPQPGTQAMAKWMMATFGCTNLGIYNNRNVVGGTTKSTHAEGRGFDAGFPYHPGGTDQGWRLANWCVANHAEFGIQQVIYARRIWSNYRDAEGWRYYNGEAAHYEHVHIENTRQAARELTAYHFIKGSDMGTLAIPEAAIEALLIKRIEQAYDLFPDRDPDLEGKRYWAGLVIQEYREGGNPDSVLRNLELGLLSELSPADQERLKDLVTQ